MPWILKVIEGFEAAHFLKDYKGKCENLHGHNWKVELEVEGEELNETGLLIDFKELKKILKEILGDLDHRLLNEIPPFDRINPSSENIAHYIYQKVKERLGKEIKVKSITVWESERASARYWE